jgi:hypothetical protein
MHSSNRGEIVPSARWHGASDSKLNSDGQIQKVRGIYGVDENTMYRAALKSECGVSTTITLILIALATLAGSLLKLGLAESGMGCIFTISADSFLGSICVLEPHSDIWGLDLLDTPDWYESVNPSRSHPPNTPTRTFGRRFRYREASSCARGHSRPLHRSETRFRGDDEDQVPRAAACHPQDAATYASGAPLDLCASYLSISFSGLDPCENGTRTRPTIDAFSYALQLARCLKECETCHGIIGVQWEEHGYLTLVGYFLAQIYSYFYCTLLTDKL